MYEACLSFLIPYSVILLELLCLLIKLTAKLVSRAVSRGERSPESLMHTPAMGDSSHRVVKNGPAVAKGARLFISMATLFLVTTTPLQVVKRWPSVAEVTRRPLLACLTSFSASCLFYASPFALLCHKSSYFRRRLFTWCCCCCSITRRRRGRRGQNVSLPVTCTQPKSTSTRATSSTIVAGASMEDAGVGACVDTPVAGVYVRRSFERIARRGRPYEATPTSVEDTSIEAPAHCISNHAPGHATSSFRRRTSWTCSPRHARSRHQRDEHGMLETDLGGVVSGEIGVVDAGERGVARCGNRVMCTSSNQLSSRRPEEDRGVVLCDTDLGIACQHSICMATLPRVKKRRIGVTTFLPLTLEPKVNCVEHTTDEDDKERRVRFID